MEINKAIKESFCVIGKEGSTADGDGFIGRLWEEASAEFAEIEQLAKKDADGNLLGMWGAMSDFTRSLKPWEDGFSKGLYLAGVECEDEAKAPEGWSKWTVPGYEYIYVECDKPDTFTEVIAYMDENGIPLAGVVHDFTCPATGKSYMYFPVRKL